VVRLNIVPGNIEIIGSNEIIEVSKAATSQWRLLRNLRVLRYFARHSMNSASFSGLEDGTKIDAQAEESEQISKQNFTNSRTNFSGGN